MRWRFTDSICSFSPWESILTLKAGTLEEYSLLERWGEPGIAPSAFLLESAVQAARWLVEASSGFTRSADPAELHQWPVERGLLPGERCCSLAVVHEKTASSICVALAQKRIGAGEKIPAAADLRPLLSQGSFITMNMLPLTDRYLPQERASLWQEIGA